jgi:hypothetical protein
MVAGTGKRFGSGIVPKEMSDYASSLWSFESDIMTVSDSGFDG